MKKTIQYTNDLSNFDINKIPLEQQICLMKANDIVKEKAMMKLKEIKSKSEDSGSKSRQYLDGLLKIPFSVYKREPILNIMEKVRNQFKDIHGKYNIITTFPEIPCKESYTSIEILKYVHQIKQKNKSSNNIEKIKQEKFFMNVPNYITREEILYLLKKHTILDHKKYSIFSLLRYNITLNPEDVPKYLNRSNEFKENQSFLTNIKNIDTIFFEKTISIFQDLNDLFFVLYEKQGKTLDTPISKNHKNISNIQNTKKIYINRLNTRSKKSTRKNI